MDGLEINLSCWFWVAIMLSRFDIFGLENQKEFIYDDESNEFKIEFDRGVLLCRHVSIFLNMMIHVELMLKLRWSNISISDENTSWIHPFYAIPS